MVDKFTIEASQSAIDKVMLTEKMKERVSLSVNQDNGKIVITAKKVKDK